MGNPEKSSQFFGFLSVVTLGTGTYVGGFLLLNSLGRPIEFHCTEAVKPTRAQEILYGSTLTPYLHAEQIGQSLTGATKIKPEIIFVDDAHSLELIELVEAPVILVHNQGEAGQATIGSNQISASAKRPADLDSVCTHWADTFGNWVLSEPFDRIREAIQETQKAA